MRAWWIEKEDLRAYRPQDGARLFKWVAFERGGEIELVAMPRDAGWTYHMEAMAELAVRKGWCGQAEADAFLKRNGNGFPEAGIRVLGGGTRDEDGSVRNYSYRFGPVPESEDLEARRTLGLAT